LVYKFLAHEYNLIFVNIEYEKETCSSPQSHNDIRQPLELLYLIINRIKKSQPSNQHKEIRKIGEKVPQRVQFIPFDLAAAETGNHTHMRNLHGSPSDIEHAWEKTVVDNF
jgi:hypothetical protein